MIAAVYGLQVRLHRKNLLGSYQRVFLQALIFIIRREFMLVGWMVVYLISYVCHHETTVGANTTP